MSDSNTTDIILDPVVRKTLELPHLPPRPRRRGIGILNLIALIVMMPLAIVGLVNLLNLSPVVVSPTPSPPAPTLAKNDLSNIILTPNSIRAGSIGNNQEISQVVATGVVLALTGTAANAPVSTLFEMQQEIVTATPPQFNALDVNICVGRILNDNVRLYALPLTRAIVEFSLPIGSVVSIVGKEPNDWYENIEWVQVYQSLPNTGRSDYYWIQRSDVEVDMNDADCLNLRPGMMR